MLQPLSYEGNEYGGDYYIDNVYQTPVLRIEPLAHAPSLVVNGGFEDDDESMAPWIFDVRLGTYQLCKFGFTGSPQSLCVTAVGVDQRRSSVEHFYFAARQTLRTVPGQLYVLSFSAMRDYSYPFRVSVIFGRFNTTAPYSDEGLFDDAFSDATYTRLQLYPNLMEIHRYEAFLYAAEEETLFTLRLEGAVAEGDVASILLDDFSVVPARPTGFQDDWEDVSPRLSTSDDM